MKCENCGFEHDGNFGSGRFCSKKCARGFSTKAKRSLINEKVSQKLKFPLKKCICQVCGTNFEYYKIKKTCSNNCSIKWNSLSQIGKKHQMHNTSKMGGLRPGGGKSHQISYVNWLGYKMSLNKEEIEVAKILDERKINWKRNTKGFPYITKEGKQRKYYPDFIINNNQYIEYKGWITEEMIWKMENAIKINNINLFVVVGNDKRYESYGISLNELKNRPLE